MRLPNPERALVTRKKLVEYLLNPTHGTGRQKAIFFSTLGYTASNAGVLEVALRALLTNDATELEETEYGTLYAIEADISGPSGQTRRVRSIWMVRHGEDFPRLVSAYKGR